jgi:hypothetical protein
MATRTPQAGSGTDYEVPVVHLRVPQRLGDAAFWVGAVGAVAAGAVEFPVAALVAAGVVVMRHRSNTR